MLPQISRLYSEYGRYINQFRAFPLTLDGCKIVERRLLYSLFLNAKDHHVKSALIVGHTIGNYHPHGDISTYGSLVQMVNNGLVDGQGNWGMDEGLDTEPPAAYRYTECRLSKLIQDIAFENIKYVRKEALELNEEPLFLPTKLPICLIAKNYCQGIGFGSRTIIPTYTIKDLTKRLKWLLDKQGTEPVIRPITNCTALSEDVDFKTLLTTGKAKIMYRGTYETDKINRIVTIRAVPPSKSLKKLLEIFQKEIEIEKSLSWRDEVTTTTNFKFIVTKRTFNIDAFIRKLSNNLVGSITFESNMCDTEGNVVLVSIDQMLLNVYENYKKIVKFVLESTITNLQSQIDELELIKKIKLVLPKYLKDFPDDPDRVISGVSADTQISTEVVQKLFEKYTIIKILKNKTDTESLSAEKNVVQTNLNNLSSFIWDTKYNKYLTE